jgi:hypothetical protein
LLHTKAFSAIADKTISGFFMTRQRRTTFQQEGGIRMPRTWYDNKKFVSALLIAFFPAGLYGLWKNSQFSSRTKGILTGLFVLAVLVGFFQAAYRETKFTTADASNPERSCDEIQRMGVSYRQATQYLGDLIPMEQGAPLNGQTRHRGTSEDHTISLEIIGDQHAITEAKMIIVPNGVAGIEQRNRTLLHRFLNNIIPEWPTSVHWANTALEKISTFQDDIIWATEGYKKVTMTRMKTSGTITVVVKHA